MALVKCKECGGQVSTEAASCPSCGAKPPKGSGCGVIVIGVLVVGLVVSLGRCSGSGDGGSQTEALSSAAAPAPNPTPDVPRQVDKAAVFAEDTRLVDEIELRMKENADLLKKYYATPERVAKARQDVLAVSLVVIKYRDTESEQERSLARRAQKLQERIERQAREMYASSLEELFVKNGLDVDVSTRGASRKELRVTYVLMSQPLVYKFQNEGRISEQASSLGFTKVVYGNGFQSDIGRTWTVDIEPTGK